MADDIVERLRKQEMLAVIGRNRSDIYREAADKITCLRAENERLRKNIKVMLDLYDDSRATKAALEEK